MGATTRMPLRAARVFMSTMATLASPQKITFAEMRESGVRGLLVYCADYRCGHSIVVSADRWPDEVQLSDIEPAVHLHQPRELEADLNVRCRRLRRSQRDLLHRHASSVVNRGIAEIERPPSIAEGDAHDPSPTSSLIEVGRHSTILKWTPDFGPAASVNA